MKRVYSIERLCLGCKLCEVGCATAHSKTGDMVKAYRFEAEKPVPRIHVEGDEFGRGSISVQCRHCDDPHCVAACITHAMSKDPLTGLVSCDADRCIGCLTCVVACPFGCIIPGDVVLKCDHCTTRVGGPSGVPACVEICPNQALVYKDIDCEGSESCLEGEVM